MVRAVALSQSVPTANTHEPLRVVTSDTVGAPEAALAPPVAPTAPEPFVPVVLTPVKLSTVIELALERARVAVTVTLLRTAGAKARQISASPATPLARFTRTQVSPAPVTLLTVCPPVEGESAETNASNNSFAAVVENAVVVTVVLEVLLSTETLASIAKAGGGAVVTTKVAFAV